MVEPIPREIELKLHVAPDDLATLRDHPGLALYRVGASRVQHLVTTYYDTPDHRLASSGLALRVLERIMGKLCNRGIQPPQSLAAPGHRRSHDE